MRAAVGTAIAALVVIGGLVAFAQWPRAASAESGSEGAEAGKILSARACFIEASQRAQRCHDGSFLQRRACVADAAEYGRACVKGAKRKRRLSKGLDLTNPDAAARSLCASLTPETDSGTCVAVTAALVPECAGPDTSSCGSKDVARCVTALALESGDPGYCEAIPAEGSVRTCLRELSKAVGPSACEWNETTEHELDCLNQLARMAESVETCKDIRYPRLKRQCIDSAATKSGDPQVCKVHGTRSERSACMLDLRGKNPNVCAEIELTLQRDMCLNQTRQCKDTASPALRRKCLLDLAQGTPSLCATATEEQRAQSNCIKQALRFIALKRLPTLDDCNGLEGKLLNSCLAYLAINQNDHRGCAAIQDEYERSECIVEIAVKAQNPALCHSLPPRRRALCFSRWSGPRDLTLCAYAPNLGERISCEARARVGSRQ